MKSQQIQIIENSYARISSRITNFSDTFHQILFALDPSLRRLLTQNAAEQKANFIKMLDFIVGALNRLEIFAPSLENLGKTASHLGLTYKDCKVFSAAFILTLRRTFKDEITAEIESAWLAACLVFAGAMKLHNVKLAATVRA